MGNQGISEERPNNQKHTHMRAEKTYSENGMQNSIPLPSPPHPSPTHTGGHMYRIMCIAGAIIGIVFIIVLIKAMKEEII